MYLEVIRVDRLNSNPNKLNYEGFLLFVYKVIKSENVSLRYVSVCGQLENMPSKPAKLFFKVTQNGS